VDHLTFIDESLDQLRTTVRRLALVQGVTPDEILHDLMLEYDANPQAFA
jgi:hypothetical protein